MQAVIADKVDANAWADMNSKFLVGGVQRIVLELELSCLNSSQGSMTLILQCMEIQIKEKSGGRFYK